MIPYNCAAAIRPCFPDSRGERPWRKWNTSMGITSCSSTARSIFHLKSSNPLSAWKRANSETGKTTYYLQKDVRGNLLEYWELRGEGKKYFSWVTDFIIAPENFYQIMCGGRARWKIENETFNTLKNQGYNFEHNYGLGVE
jgi:hypothetical protein